MTKRHTSRRTHSEHGEHMYRLWKLRTAMRAVFWAVVGHGVLVLGIALTERAWP